MHRIDILNELNNYFLADEQSSKQKIIELMNSMIEESAYKENLDLFFMAISITQLYGFLSYLSEEEKNIFFLNDYFRPNSYSSEKLGFFNSGQLSLLNEIDKHEKVFISAPTSFGKTSLVNEYVLNNLKRLKFIIYIVPTNSLLEELYIKFTNYFHGKNDVYISTQPLAKDNVKNILFLTPERFLAFCDENSLDKIDLIVMDETYQIMEFKKKVVSDFINNRGVRFRKVADIIGESKCKTIYLSPFTYELTESMERFLKKYKINKIDRKIEYVSHNILKANNTKNINTIFSDFTKQEEVTNVWEKTSKILEKLVNEKNIVYVGNFQEAYKIADHFSLGNHIVKKDYRFQAFLKHLNDTLCIDDANKWKAISSLEKGIGIYISPLPRYIKREIIKLFEGEALHTLIVTTSFTEGVNTSAKNLIFTSLYCARNIPLSSIDILNVAGRAGRFGKNSIGKIYCINKDIFERLTNLQENALIKLENYNYMLDQNGNPKDNLIDFEIDMMEDEYLNEKEKEEKNKISNFITNYGLTKSDLNISLNVSNKWKMILYSYFCHQTIIKNEEYFSAISDLLDEKNKVQSIGIIFTTIKKCFREYDESIDPFPGQNYDIRAFDCAKNFTWGRLYKLYSSGTYIDVIRKNREYIQQRYKAIMDEAKSRDPKEIKVFFEKNDSLWVLNKYYKSDCMSENKDAFYTEAFKFMSTVIQYKIPFYLSYFISMFKLYASKKTNFDCSKIDLKKIIMSFEDGTISDEQLRPLIDYGISNDLITKIKNNQISTEAIVLGNYDKTYFDEFEQLLLEDFANTMK